MDDLVTFLRARLDEDAGRIPPFIQVCDSDFLDLTGAPSGGISRVQREVEAKWGIVEIHRQVRMSDGNTADCAQCWGAVWPCPTMRLVASVYADHPDYRAEWADEA